MEIKITDTQLINDLHSYNMLINSNLAVITKYINSNYDITNDSFKAYQTEYNNHCNIFEEKKKELREKYIVPVLEDKNVKYTWELDYNTGIITVTFN